MKCPKFLDTIIFADDAKLAAKASCLLAVPGCYLPICDGPRLQRPDGDAEVVRRQNAAARSRAKAALSIGLSRDSHRAMKNGLRIALAQLASDSDLSILTPSRRRRSSNPLIWGRDRIGVGLLKALRLGASIEFNDSPSPIETVSSPSGHLVVYEDDDDISQVIAANYAFALNAGLCLIPGIERQSAEDLLEYFYRMNDADSALSPSEARHYLIGKMKDCCRGIALPENGSITFIGSLPYGFAFKEVPSTHLFDYPDLGLSIINGFSSEQAETTGTGVVVLVDPGRTRAPEIKAAVDLLEPRRAFIRVYEGPSANVRHVTEMIEHFPYDLLIIATHCGDSSGYRWTYEFTDSEGIHRTLVTDIAVGFAPTDDPEIVSVTQFMRFVSLDGVDWNNPEEKKKLYVGSAMNDFMSSSRTGPRELEPVKKEDVSRVV